VLPGVPDVDAVAKKGMPGQIVVSVGDGDYLADLGASLGSDRHLPSEMSGALRLSFPRRSAAWNWCLLKFVLS